MVDSDTPPGIDIRPLDDVEQVHAASRVLAEVWGGDRSGMPPNLLRALAHSGNYAVGLYQRDRMIGASVAFFAAPEERSMHSHITGVLPGSIALCSRNLHEMREALAAGRQTRLPAADPVAAD